MKTKNKPPQTQAPNLLTNLLRKPPLVIVFPLIVLGLVLVFISCIPQRIAQKASIPATQSMPTKDSEPSKVEMETAVPVTISGVLSLRGHEPFTIVALETPEEESYGIIGKYEKLFRELAGKGNVVVRVEGDLVKRKTLDVRSYEILSLPKGEVLRLHVEFFEKRNEKTVTQIHEVEFKKGRYLTDRGIVIPNSVIGELSEVIYNLHGQWVQAESTSIPPSNYYAHLQVYRAFSDKQVYLWLLPKVSGSEDPPSKWLMQKWGKDKVVVSTELTAAFQQLLGSLNSSLDILTITSSQER